MSQADRHRAAERIPKELLEADFEIAFNLIDLFQAEFAHDRSSALRALHDAEDVFLNIERRLNLIAALDRQSFDPLIGELKRAIALAKSQQAGDAGGLW